MISAALLDLADTANCISGDFHLMHLIVKDEIMHAALKTYYEEAAEDYDSYAELALMEQMVKPGNPNNSAARIEWMSYVNEDDMISRAVAIEEIDKRIDTYVYALTMVFEAAEKSKQYGIAEVLQARIAYWDKERRYFNRRRFV